MQVEQEQDNGANGTIRVWANLPEELATFVDEFAKKYLVSRSGAVREIIRRYKEG